jgi:hypothetical protein
MKDVYDWVQSMLVDHQATSCSSAHVVPSFELYLCPPRTLLQPAELSDKGPPTLSDLHLVPAALLHLSWKSGIPPACPDQFDGLHSSSVSQATNFCYIRSELLPTVGCNESSANYPSGIALTHPSKTENASNEKIASKIFNKRSK